MKRYISLILMLTLVLGMNAQKKQEIPPLRSAGGHLDYTADERGNRVPDYSYCGYMASEALIPMVPVKAVVPLAKGDRTAEIQAALDYVASLTPDAEGFRGTVLLEAGQYEISGTLWIKASGVVLRGSGMTGDGTEILSTSTDRITMIRFQGQDDRSYEKALNVADRVIPTGAMSIQVPGHKFKAGQTIVLRQGMAVAADNERQGARAMAGPSAVWERGIRSVNGASLELDAPVTSELSSERRPLQVQRMQWPGRITGCGLENLRMTSVYDEANPKDENHAWIAVAMENIRDAWVRRIEFRHLAGSAVYVTESASRITIEDCKSLEPVSEIGSQRRYSFYIKGSQCLCQRIQAESGYHDFAVGAAVGPNAFVQCRSMMPFSYSGTIESESNAVLFDICYVDGNRLSFGEPNAADAFAGCNTSNSMMWNSQAAIVSCPKPARGQNWSFGAWGGFNGKGYWNGANNHSSPWSIYYTQLRDRTGQRNPNEEKLMPLGRGGVSSYADAVFQTQAARRPLKTMSQWMDSLALDEPLDIRCPDSRMKTVWTSFRKTPVQAESHPLVIREGIISRQGKILTGRRQNPSWWRGSMATPAAMDPHIVRFALGPEGYGIIDDLDVMTDQMLQRDVLVTDFNYALWYDRRRDDHQRTARINGEVRPPLYELPFARSGQGKAWDGLSRYDLTRWNNWYWNRLKTYARLADEKNLVLFYQNYFQHNILEAGAHWADFPWRSTNNVNETDFPDPTPYAGNKRVFMAEHFYDVNHPVRRELHRRYIRKCLDNFAETGSVIHFTSAEYSGPLHFVEFWLDVIAEWEAETGKNALVALSAPKNVQEAILKDSKRAKTVDIIDIRYWYTYGASGEFAPDGGLNLTPRQFERIMKPAAASAGNVYQMVRTYREAYPEKAVLYSASSYPEQAWSAFMAGASLCPLPAGLPDAFLQQAASMHPVKGDCWTLAAPGRSYAVYPDEGRLSVDLSSEQGAFTAQWLDLRSGAPVGKSFSIQGGSVHSLSAQGLLWLYR